MASIAEGIEAAPATLAPGGRWAVVERIGTRLTAGLAAIQAALLVVTLALMLVSIVMRYAVNHSLASGEDLEVFLFTWLIFLGIPRTLWRDEAPRLVLVRSSSPGASAVVRGIGLGAVLAFMAYLLLSYAELFPFDAGTTIPVLGWPKYSYGLAVAVSAGLSVLISLLLLARDLHGNHARRAATLSGFLVAALATLVCCLADISNIWLGLGGAAVLILVGVPIAVAIGIGGVALAAAGGGVPHSLAALELSAAPNNIVLVSLPMFLLAGAYVAHTSLAHRLSRFARALFGRLPGGLGVADVGASAIFANMSGSAVGDTAALGTVFIPRLVEEGGLRRVDAAALQSAAGVIGVIFPPAVAMILFATVSEASVIKVFEATVIPGCLVALGMAAMAVWLQSRRGTDRPTAAARVRHGGLAELLHSVPGAIPVLLIPIILDGGILSGTFTPAEAGAVAVLVIAVITAVKHEVSPRRLGTLLVKAVDTTMVPMFILVNVAILDWGFAASGIARKLTGVIDAVGHSSIVFLLVVSVFLLLIHTVIETAPSILVFVPLILPAAQAAHVSVLQLGAVVAINSTIGLMLPPVGTALFVSSQIAGVEPRDVIRPVLPYVAMSLVMMIAVILVPPLSLWLPGSGK